MNFDDNNIDDLFKSKLTNSEHDLDQDLTWEAVKSQLPKKKKRAAFWIFSFLGLAVASSLIWFLFNSNNSDQSASKIAIENKITNTELSIDSKISDLSKSQLNENKAELNNNNNNNNNNNLINTDSEVESNNEFNSSESDQKEELENKIKSNPSAQKSNIESQILNEISIKNTSKLNYLKGKNIPSFNSNKKGTEHNNESINSKENNNVQLDNGFSKVNTNINSSDVMSENLIINNDKIEEGNSETNLLNKAIVSSLFNANEPFDFISNLKIKPIDYRKELLDLGLLDVMKPRRKKRKSSATMYFADISGGGILPFVSNVGNTINENQDLDFLNEWERVQSPVAGYSFRVLGGVRTEMGFELSTGIELQKYYQKAQLQKTEITASLNWDERAAFYRDSTDNIVWVADSVIWTSTHSYKYKAKQTHTIVNIPIQVGYMYEVEKWNLGLQVAAIINIKQSFKGKVLSKNGFEDIDDDNQIYRNKVGLSWQAGLHFGYDLSEHMEIYLNPHFNLNRKDRLKSDHLIRTMHNLGKVNLGIRYSF